MNNYANYQADGQSPDPADYYTAAYTATSTQTVPQMPRNYGGNYGMGSLRSTRSAAAYARNESAARLSHTSAFTPRPSQHLQPYDPDASERRTPDTLAAGMQPDQGYRRIAAGRPSSRSGTQQLPYPDEYTPRSTSMRRYRVAGEYEDSRATPPADTHGRSTTPRAVDRSRAPANVRQPARTSNPISPGPSVLPSQHVEFGYASPAMAMMAHSPERDEIPDIIAGMSTARISARADRDAASASGSSADDVSRKNTRVVYLQLGDDIKKAVLAEEPSHTNLVHLFIDKYQSRLSEDPDTLPAIYIKDSKANVFYELEDMADVTTGALLCWRAKPLQKCNASKAENRNDNEEQQNQQQQSIDKLSGVVNTLADAVAKLPAQMKDEMQTAIDAVKQQTADSVSSLITSALDQLSADIMKQQPQSDAMDSDSLVMGATKSSLPRSASMPLASDARVAELHSKLRKAELALSVERQQRLEDHAASERERAELASELEKLQKNVGSHPNVLRTRIEDGKQMLKTKYRDLNTHFEDVHTMVQEMRKDVTQRGAMPSAQLMKRASGELKHIQEDTNRLLKFINETRSDWKRTWEEELQNILKEQSFVKDVEQMLGELNDDSSHLEDVLDKLDKIIDLKLEERAKEGYVPRAATRFLDVVSPDDAPDAKKDFLMQISCVDIDHNRRLDALDAAERLRKKELAAKVNEFDEELSDFVSQRKLRKTGGTQELERRRAEKNLEVMKDMLKSVEDAELARRAKIAQRKAGKKTQKKQPRAEEDDMVLQADDQKSEQQQQQDDAEETATTE
ncbi:Bud site selection protein 6 [Coemansia spiralis]|uniref:Bud site selection protein 6 n=2 Tax=Coemansia TaxID=4863 RepID=A0A9W8KYB9_9FUNG|nr:Bud site selection protein 6 [Coemansia umbellata]KAJ2621541.1 Bud site selection protein 6 [Coemansia sp. RSA 1358]KAJ2676735.1 Bud site selection protein 6 [Coemansia spiralis]